jgi:hypothetical protein
VPYASPSSWIPSQTDAGGECEQHQVRTQKPYKKGEIAHPLALMWSGDIPAHTDQVVPRLTEEVGAITMDRTIDIELGAILPNGSMARNAAAEASEGGKLCPQRRHPRTPLVGRREEGLPLGHFELQEGLTPIARFREPGMPLHIAGLINSCKPEITGGTRAKARTHPNGCSSVMSLLVDAPLPTGGDVPQSQGTNLIPRKPGTNGFTCVRGEHLPSEGPLGPLSSKKD